MPRLDPSAVGPYIGLIAYARAAGAPNRDAARAIVDTVLAENPDRQVDDLLPMIDGRAGGYVSGIVRP